MAASSAPDYEGEVRDLVQSLIAGCIQEISSEVPLETISLPSGEEINPEECMETIEELIKVKTGKFSNLLHFLIHMHVLMLCKKFELILIKFKFFTKC